MKVNKRLSNRVISDLILEFLFVAFLEDNATMTLIRYFEKKKKKSCIVFCAKPKEVDPIKLNFSMTIKCFDKT